MLPRKLLKISNLLALKILLAGCNPDPGLDLKLYQGDSASLKVTSDRHGDVKCYEYSFDQMTCTWTEDLAREIKELRAYVKKCERCFNDKQIRKASGESHPSCRD